MCTTLLDVDPAKSSIVSFCVSPGDQFLISLEVSTAKPLQVYVKIKRLHETFRVSEYKLPLELSSAVLQKDSFKIQIVQVSKVTKNVAEMQHYLVVNTGDGLHFISLEGLLLGSSSEQPQKWHHTSLSDTITSFYSYNIRGSALQTVYSTKLGSIVKMDFNIVTNAFRKIEEHKDIAGDCLNSCSPCLPINPDPEVINIPELVFSSFDNHVYSLEKTVQKLPIVECMSEGKTLVCAASVIAKQYSTKSLRFYVANVLNGGCSLFKRSASGSWDKVQVFDRTAAHEEQSPLIDCVIKCQGRSQLYILSGSDCGKIFSWTFDYRDEVLVENEVYEVGQSDDTVYGLQLVGGSVYYLLNRDLIGRISIS